MALVNLNIAPYFDDYDPAKDYLRVLFRPGYPVQARELTTLQSMLQEQIARFGNHIFKDGSRVTGASINVDTTATRLLLVAGGSANFPITGRTERLAPLQEFVGLVVSNTDGTIKAKVLQLPNGVSGSSQLGPIYLKYITSNTFTTPGFQNDPITAGYLFARASDNPTLTSDIFNVFSGVSPCTLALVEEGVYYVGGEFIRVAEQIVIVSDTTNRATAALGFTVTTSFVSANEDPTLYDNARNSPNEGAPGANRLKITLAFSVRSVGENGDPSFYRLVVITDGVIQTNKVSNPQYAELLNTLARRTYDESGNYALAPFTPNVNEGTDETKFTLSLGPSKAYVRGYEIQTIANTDIAIDRGLDTVKFGPPTSWAIGSSPLTVPVPGPSFIQVVNATGTLPGFGTAGQSGASSAILYLWDDVPAVGTRRFIGTARAWGFESTDQSGGGYLYMFDVNMHQLLTTASTVNIPTGYDVVDRNGTTGYRSQNPAAADPLNTIRVSGTSTTMSPGTIRSNVGNLTFNATAATLFQTSQIKYISGSGTDIFGSAFAATVATGAVLENGSTPLVYPFDKTLKTANDDNGMPVANDYNILAPDASGRTTTNDMWKNGPNNEWENYNNIVPIPPINKTLRFAALRIRNTAYDSDNYRALVGANFGWSGVDQQICLTYPDVQTIYKVIKGSQLYDSDGAGNIDSESHAIPNFLRISIAGPTIPVGHIITGQTSGARAVVAVTNSLSRNVNTRLINTGSGSSTKGWHETITGTGNTKHIDVVMLAGTFSPNETAVATEQSDRIGESGYSYTLTIDSDFVIIPQDPDITSLYLVDNGQRDEYYDVARIVRKNKTPAPTMGDILVFFSYYVAENNGTTIVNDFYNVDSYASSGFFDNDVRYYSGPQDIVMLDPLGGQDLRNTIDFRHRIRENANNSLWNITINPFTSLGRTFWNQSHATPFTSLSFSGEEYLGRIDTITLDKDGVFRDVHGVPSLNPVQNPVDPEVMTLNYVTIPPAVRYATRQVQYVTEDNRRYTMRDIGAIEARINRLETAVSLSLLESQALNDQPTDAAGGSAYRLGFITDDFSTPDVDDGSVNAGLSRDWTNDEYNASVDVVNKLLRAESADMRIVMELDSEALVNIDPFYLERGYLTKSYTSVPLFGENWQSAASSTIRINPYATWVYQGNITLKPKQDFWRAEVSDLAGTPAITMKIELPTRNINGVNVLDPKFFDQYEGVLQKISGAPFNRNELRWGGRRLVSNTTRGESNSFGGDVVSFANAGLRSRNFEQTGVRTQISGIQVQGANLRSLAKVFGNREVVEAPQTAFMQDAGLMKQNPERGIRFNVTRLRPSTTLKATFDGVDVTRYCRQFNANGSLGAYGSLVTDNDGNINGNFAIPGGTFNIGTRNFVLTDLDGNFTTFASAAFTSAGTWVVYDGPIYNFSADAPFVLGTAMQTNETRRTRELYDPIAQSFTLPLAEGLDPGSTNLTELAQTPGAFITSVDVYFGYVDTRPLNDFVNLQIRSMVNGYPGPDVIGRGSITITEANGSDNGSVATNIKLEAPTYLLKNTEYCIVLLSPSDRTTVWVATQGERDAITGGLITKQPNVGGYYGSFFTSQNNSTWNADQNRDMKFNMYRAQFTTAPSSFRLVNTPSSMYANINSDDQTQLANGLETFANCRFIKVYCPNHGMYLERPSNPYIVTVDGVTANIMDAYAGDSFNGIPLSVLNEKQFNVRYPTLHSYFIELPSTVDISKIIAGTGGGNIVVVPQQRQFAAIKTNLNAVNFFTTGTSMTLRTVTGNTIDFTEDSDSGLLIYNTSDSFGMGNDFDCTVDEYCEFEEPQVLFNSLNQPLALGEANSISATITMTNSDNTLSPVIRTDAITYFNAYRNNISHVFSDSEALAKLNSTPLGPNDTADDRQAQFVSYQAAIQAAAEDANYITKQVDLDMPGTGINVMFDADMEPGSSIEFYYKTRAPGVNTPFTEIPWVTFPTDQYITEDKYGIFASATQYVQYKAVADTPDYTSFQVKFRMRSVNEAQTPRIRNVRIIALTSNP